MNIEITSLTAVMRAVGRSARCHNPLVYVARHSPVFAGRIAAEGRVFVHLEPSVGGRP